MPKVLVTLPQDLIARLDAVAPVRGSRSAEIERRLSLSFFDEDLTASSLERAKADGEALARERRQDSNA